MGQHVSAYCSASTLPCSLEALAAVDFLKDRSRVWGAPGPRAECSWLQQLQAFKCGQREAGCVGSGACRPVICHRA